MRNFGDFSRAVARWRWPLRVLQPVRGTRPSPHKPMESGQLPQMARNWANHRGLKSWNPAKNGESTNMSKFINPHVHVHEEAWRSMISKNWGSQLLKQVWGKWLPNTPWGLIRMTDRFATDSCDFSMKHQLPTGITPKGCIVAPSEGENFTKWFQRQDGRPRSHGVADSCHDATRYDKMNHPWCIMILHNALNPKTIKHRRNHYFMGCIIIMVFFLLYRIIPKVVALVTKQPFTYKIMTEGSLEVKLPTIWTDEKESREEAERREILEERKVDR